MVTLHVPEGFVGNPVQLTFGKSTRLLLNVTRDPKSSNHTIQGWLKYGSAPVASKTVVVKVNDTQYALTTDGSGHFVKSVGLQPSNNTSTLYVISASFDGDTAVTATASAKTLEGTEYAACTTIQYNDYKPSANSTTLTIEPQATQVAQSTKTPEQTQQEAEQSGGLTIWTEFSWSYPWFRVHMKIHVNPTIELAFNPILPGGEMANWDGLDFFKDLSWEVLQEIGLEALSFMTVYLVARYFSFSWAGIAAWGVKAVIQGLTFLSNWNDAPRLKAAGIISIAMAIFAMVNYYIDVQTNFLRKFVDVLWRIVGHSVQGGLRWLLMRFTEMVEYTKGTGRRWLDAAECALDFSIGLAALLRYVDLTT